MARLLVGSVPRGGLDMKVGEFVNLRNDVGFGWSQTLIEVNGGKYLVKVTPQNPQAAKDK